MAALIDDLQLLDERDTPGGEGWNMAADEALLQTGTGAVLRCYRWSRPALSFGYFLPWDEAAKAAGDRALMRRWTGGGMVEHGEDFTWSLIVPAGEPLAGLRPVESYAVIHGALAGVLGAAGLPVFCAGIGLAAPATGFCFTAPALGDVLLSGRKVAGAGQRRCRQGLLHQGSILGVSLPDDFPNRLAAAIGRSVRAFDGERFPRAAAEELVRSRYGTESWLKRR